MDKLLLLCRFLHLNVFHQFELVLFGDFEPLIVPDKILSVKFYNNQSNKDYIKETYKNGIQ
jgi:hypothetical protein